MLELKDLKNKEVLEKTLDLIRLSFYTKLINNFGEDEINSEYLKEYYKNFHPDFNEEQIQEHILQDTPENNRAKIQYINSLNYNSIFSIGLQYENKEDYKCIVIGKSTLVKHNITDSILKQVKVMIKNGVPENTPVVLIDTDANGVLIPEPINLIENNE